ncbi:MAG: hypothetical protein Ta2F_12270 [Termitinemataceae bacterium]|nr:MAG: hypothetical protein Ta2F_12270 [Termitinemataceae bacterium]
MDFYYRLRFLLLCFFVFFACDVFADETLKLIPQNEHVKKICTETVASLKPSVVVEKQKTIKKPDSWKQGIWTNEEEIKLLNAVSSISTLSGLQYYSASRGEMRTFYETSYVIQDPKLNKPVPDPVFTLSGSLPESFMFFARQKDLTFSDNIYQYDYSITSDAIFFVQKNLTAMSYGIIPLLKKEALKSIVAFVNNQDSITIYVVTMAKANLIPALEQKVNNSFSTRIDALIKWFEDKDLR